MNLDKRLLGLVRPARLWLGLTVALGGIAGILLVAQARALSGAIARVFLGGATLADVTPLLLLLGGIALARAAAVGLEQVTAQRVAGRVKQDVRAALSRHLLALGPAYAQGERSGELANTLTQGVEELDAYFREYLPALFLAAIVPLTFLIFILPVEPLTGIVLLLTAPLIPFFMVLIGRLARAVTARQWQTLSRMSAHFLDVLQGLTTLKLFGRSRRQIEVIAQISDRWRETTLGVLRVAFLSAFSLELIATLSTAVVAVEIGVRLLYGRLGFEEALFVLVLAPDFYLPLRTLGARFHAGMSGVAAAERLFAVLETPAGESGGAAGVNGVGARHASPLRDISAEARIVGAQHAAPDDGWVADVRAVREPPLQGSFAPVPLVFTDVRYAYDGGRRVALDGVTFTLQAGEQLALVGPSGAGKSTIASLLLRFIAPDAGTITAGGVPLASIPPDDWRARVAWVPQRPTLFDASALDNIRLGNPHATPDEVTHAARQAGAHDFIRALPDGYATLIGERGARLSGGQAQRIALARAFLRDAPLLILDEATANLDAESEALVQAAIARLVAGRTALIIAHRLNTVARADRIVVLAEGRVAESGRPADLLAAGGLYAGLMAAYGG